MEAIDKYTVTDDLRPVWADHVKKLSTLTGILEPNEKILMDLYFNHKATVYQLSLLSGRSQKAVGHLIKRLVRQLSLGHYPMLYRHRDRFSPEKVKVGYDHYLLGLGYRVIAEKRQLPVRTVRDIVRSLDRWVGRRKKV